MATRVYIVQGYTSENIESETYAELVVYLQEQQAIDAAKQLSLDLTTPLRIGFAKVFNTLTGTPIKDYPNHSFVNGNQEK